MKKLSFILFLIVFSLTGYAQDIKQNSIETRIQAIEDRMAIKQVVDEFSNLADTKEIAQQVLLFTEDGIVQSYSNGKLSSDLKGRKELEERFAGFLARFHTVYHQNGQQTIDELTATTAKTTSYCRVILVGEQNGKQNKTTMYTIYKDEFVKQEGKWLIKKRISNFIRTETEEVK